MVIVGFGATAIAHYRPWSSGTPAGPKPMSAQEAVVRAFVGVAGDGGVFRVRENHITYPGGTLTRATLKTSAGRYQFWLGTRADGPPSVVRMVAPTVTAVASAPAAGAPWPDTSEDEAQALAEQWAAKTPGFAASGCQPVAEPPGGPFIAETESELAHFSFTWQRVDVDEVLKEAVRLPRWVSVWVDGSGSRVSRFDSLQVRDVAASDGPPGFDAAGAIDAVAQSGASPKSR